MNQNSVRGFVQLVAAGLLVVTLTMKAPPAWNGGDVFLLALLTAILTPTALGLLRVVAGCLAAGG